MFPDAHCELRICTGNSGCGVAESFSSGTRAGHGRIEAIGAEVLEIVDGRSKRSAIINKLCRPKRPEAVPGGACVADCWSVQNSTLRGGLRCLACRPRPTDSTEAARCREPGCDNRSLPSRIANARLPSW